MTTARNEAIAVGSTDARDSDPEQREPAPLGPAAARLDALIESVPGIVFQRLLRPDGTLSYPFVSQSVALHTGYRPEHLRLARDGSLDVIHWADRDAYLERVHESARTLTTCEEGFRVIARSGEVRWLAGASVPRRQEDGSVLWDGTLINVTDQKRAEQWLGMVMDHAADVIITMNDAGLIDSSNAASRVVFGCDPDSLVGQPASILMPQLEQGDLSEVLRRYLNTGETTLVGQGPRELIGRHCNGLLFPIEMVLSEVLTEGRRLFIAVIRDISQRKETETALLETQRRLTNIADNLQGLVFQRVLTDDGHLRFLYITGMTLETLGLSSQAVVDDGHLLLNAMDPEDRGRLIAATHHSARTLEPMEDDYKIVSREGVERWLRGWSRPHRAADGTVVWEGVALDVTDRRQAEKRLMFLAYHDALTGLGNRTLFLDRFAALIGGQGPGGDSPSRWALVAIGLDRFSIINGTLGHAMGDRVLVAVAHRLREPLGGHELLCRTGGDRFMMLLTDCDTDAALHLALNDLLAKFQRPLEVGGHQFDLSISLGVSLFPDHGQDAETLIMHADAALHEAKSEGGGACRLFTPAISEQANLILTMRHRMRRALEENQFKAYFQAQVDLATDRIVGTEALARWIAPDGAQVSPGEFIPIAEEYGLIDEICVQVMEDACRWTAHWNTLGLGDISVAVNISGRQFHNSRHLVDIVDTALTNLRLAPHLLDLELTESAAMSDPENASRVMRMFTDRGIGCSIDDFGTGHSSLAVLKRFTLRTLKIDRSFVKDVTHAANDAAICSAIIAMAHALNLKVCAEGAETPEQLEFLRAHGCDKVQGFVFAKPLPPEDMERLLKAGIPAALRGNPVAH